MPQSIKHDKADVPIQQILNFEKKDNWLVTDIISLPFCSSNSRMAKNSSHSGAGALTVLKVCMK